jgi:hypothetical protein
MASCKNRLSHHILRLFPANYEFNIGPVFRSRTTPQFRRPVKSFQANMVHVIGKFRFLTYRYCTRSCGCVHGLLIVTIQPHVYVISQKYQVYYSSRISKEHYINLLLTHLPSLKTYDLWHPETKRNEIMYIGKAYNALGMSRCHKLLESYRLPNTNSLVILIHVHCVWLNKLGWLHQNPWSRKVH